MSDIVELILKERSGVSREDIQKVRDVIDKYQISLPEKMPTEYEGKSVFEAYLMAWYKKEKDLKPAEKKLIKEVIKFAAKDEKEAAKIAEKAAKMASKA
jgi:IMP dehydrogenase/GMP reductase